MAIFTNFGSVLAIPANIEWLGIKKFCIARYPSDEASVKKNFRAMDKVVLEEHSVKILNYSGILLNV